MATKKPPTKNNRAKKRGAKKPPEQIFHETDDRVTGDKLVAFKMRHGLSIQQMGTLFGVGFVSIGNELNRGAKGIESRGICYLYRLYMRHPEFLEKEVSVKEFYAEIGGEKTCSGPTFSLVLGMEQSAYARYFRSGNPSKSVQKTIDYAKRLANNDPIKAYGIIEELAREEGESRGFDPLYERTWNPSRGKTSGRGGR